jgi:hypothetical protein
MLKNRGPAAVLSHFVVDYVTPEGYVSGTSQNWVRFRPLPGAPSAPRQRPKSFARRLSAAHAFLLSQPDDKHVRPAWRSLRAPRRPAFARDLVRAAGRQTYGSRRTCVLTSNNCANDTPRIRNFDRKRSRTRPPTYKSHREEIRERLRRKRETDPAYRQKRIAAAQAYREAHKEELSGRRRRDPMTRRKHRLRGVYGISREEYDAMLDSQGGVCAICKKKPDEGKALFVDHCHVTGRVRGLLCGKCNSVLAFGNDNPDILRAAIAYLRAARDRDRNVTAPDTPGASGRAMRPLDIVAADAKPYDSGVT